MPSRENLKALPDLGEGKALGGIEMFGAEDVIFSYTSQQAAEDGILVKLSALGFNVEPFNYVTNNLLSKGYLGEDEPHLEAIDGLLNEAILIMAHAGKGDWLYSGEIALPSGEMQKIFICQNETGKFTLMLPEDY